MGGRRGGEELDRPRRKESQMVGTHNHPISPLSPLNHSPPFFLYSLSLCFFTASLIVDFYCISPTPEGATGPLSPTLLVKIKKIK